jgi:hypothetical protein
MGIFWWVLFAVAPFQDNVHPSIQGNGSLPISCEELRILKETGQFPTTLDLLVKPGPAAPVQIDMPLDMCDPPELNRMKWPKCQAYLLPQGRREHTGYVMEIWFTERSARFREPWKNASMKYLVNQDSVFPLMDGNLYHAIIGPESLQLRNVTGAFAKGDRPRKSSLTISCNSVGSRYFQHEIESSRYGKVRVFMEIRKAEISTESVASVTWVAEPSFTQLQPASSAEWMEFWKGLTITSDETKSRLRKGDVFMTGARSYKVRNIVPPGVLPNGGHCEGWIELDEIEPPK